ncbi:MAG: methyltransferase domain-containing protein [Candidatus Aureabacteria bacterium]|nr:methyltransferase domain-containing protein [Candidatus Auribacterota bacterium]
MSSDIPLLCPECRHPLSRKGNGISCDACRGSFPLDDDIPILLPLSLGQFKERESAYHAALSEEFEDIHNLDAGRVARFKEEYHRYLGALEPGSVILELGCGTGWDTARLAARGMAVYLSDISPGMVRKARERVRTSGAAEGAVSFFVFDAEAIPFPSDNFDAVFITAALHHLPSPERSVAEMRRVCRPGGVVVLGFEPNSWPYYTLFPARRFVSVLVKAAALFIRSPREALRKAKTVRRAKGVLIETRGSDAELYSPGDREASGFSRRRIARILKGAGLEPVSVSRVWYLNGFIQEFSLLRKFRSPSPRVEAFLIGLDRLLARIPVVRMANWHWNVIAKKP